MPYILIILTTIFVSLPLYLFFSKYKSTKTQTSNHKPQQQLSTLERMPKHYDDAAAGSETKLMTHLYDDAKTILESLERGCSLNGQWSVY